MDNNFEALKPNPYKMNVTLNTTAVSKHVLEVERQIRVVKEFARTIWNSLTFYCLPNRLIYQMIS